MGVFDFSGAESGAGIGAASGNPWAALGLALLGGIFGRQEEYTPAQQLEMRLAQQEADFANSVPLSDPGEQGALAEERGMLGEQQRNDLGVLAGMSPNNATMGAGAVADQVKNMRLAQTGQQMSITSSALLNALQARRKALQNSADMARGVGKPEIIPGVGQDLASLWKAYNAYRAAQGQSAGNGYGAGGPNSQTASPGGYGTNVPLGGGYNVNLPPEYASAQGQGYGVTTDNPTATSGASTQPAMPQFGAPQQNLGQMQPGIGGMGTGIGNNPPGLPTGGPDFSRLFSGGMQNYTNGMGSYFQDLFPQQGRGFGFPSGNSTPTENMGVGGNIYQQLMQGMGGK